MTYCVSHRWHRSTQIIYVMACCIPTVLRTIPESTFTFSSKYNFLKKWSTLRDDLLMYPMDLYQNNYQVWITPGLNGFSIGAWLAASIPMLITFRVSFGSMMASTHKRAAAYSGVVCSSYLAVISASIFS